MKTDTIYHMGKGYTIKVTAKPDSTPTNPTKSFSVYRYGKFVSSVDTWRQRKH